MNRRLRNALEVIGWMIVGPLLFAAMLAFIFGLAAYADDAEVRELAVRGTQMQLTDPPASPTTIALPPHYSSWLRIAECESNGRWDINTGNGYYGGLQFDLTTWRATGRTGYPHHHTMLEQMWAAERVLELRAGWGLAPWGAWPVCGRLR